MSNNYFILFYFLCRVLYRAVFNSEMAQFNIMEGMCIYIFTVIFFIYLVYILPL